MPWRSPQDLASLIFTPGNTPIAEQGESTLLPLARQRVIHDVPLNFDQNDLVGRFLAHRLLGGVVEPTVRICPTASWTCNPFHCRLE